MQFTHVVISLIFSIASPSSAETTWKDDSADLTLSNSDIFDNHEASPSFDPDLFSNADPLNTNLDDFSSSINFLTEAGVNDHAAASCLSSSFGNSLAVNDLQARSSPKCPNPLQNSDSGILNINTILDPEDLEEFSNDYTIPWTEPNLHVCPYERYGYRSLPLCDSGSQYDIVEDAFVWNIDLINPSAYYGSCLTSIEQGWCCEFCIYQAGVRSRRTNYQKIETYWTGQDCWRFDSTSIDTQPRSPL